MFFTYFLQVDYLCNLSSHAFNSHIPRNHRSNVHAYRVAFIFKTFFFLLPQVEVTVNRHISAFTDCTFNLDFCQKTISWNFLPRCNFPNATGLSIFIILIDPAPGQFTAQVWNLCRDVRDAVETLLWGENPTHECFKISSMDTYFFARLLFWESRVSSSFCKEMSSMPYFWGLFNIYLFIYLITQIKDVHSTFNLSVQMRNTEVLTNAILEISQLLIGLISRYGLKVWKFEPIHVQTCSQGKVYFYKNSI